MDPRQLEARKRLLEDYDFYSPNALKIRTKGGEIVPLTPKPAQRILRDAIERQLESTGRVRLLVLKARQQGLSTDIGGFMYYQISQRKGAKAIVLAHKADSTNALFGMVRRYHDNCPEFLRPSTKYANKRELFFDKLDSQYTVSTAGGDAVARGETNTHIHASELAFWPKTSAREIWNGLSQSCPDKPGTAIFIESTANGVSGLFYELYKGAILPPGHKDKNEYELVFIPWFLDPDYAIAAHKGFLRTPEEKKIVARALKEYQIALSDGQLSWRRQKIANGNLDLFRQEYPAYPEEAFLTSGRPIFNPDQLGELLDNALDYTQVSMRALEAGKWEEHPRGELAVYHEPDPLESYVIGADVAAGVRGGDYSVAQVLDSKKRLVAKWRSHIIPDGFSDVLDALGKWYNHGRLVVENNNHGVLTCYRLSKDLNYPNLYQSVQHDKTTDKETTVVGFSTTVKTKPLIIDGLRAAMRDRELDIRDKETLREMQSYILSESGGMEAEEGCHDDCVISLALANYAHAGMPRPVKFDDNYYEDGL